MSYIRDVYYESIKRTLPPSQDNGQRDNPTRHTHAHPLSAHVGQTFFGSYSIKYYYYYYYYYRNNNSIVLAA
jgi:hypothetical protein